MARVLEIVGERWTLLIMHRAYQDRPERHEYVLTPSGRELFPVVIALMRWGDAHLSPEGAPAVVLHAGCGGVIDAHATCERCDPAVGSDEVEWHYGPASGRPPGPRPSPLPDPSGGREAARIGDPSARPSCATPPG